jgi:CheY-like chemotaxis protein
VLYQPFGLVISDLRMPRCWAPVPRAENATIHVKIILLSAFADDSTIDISTSLGVPLLSKPFVPDRLLEVIDQLLDLRMGKLGQ